MTRTTACALFVLSAAAAALAQGKPQDMMLRDEEAGLQMGKPPDEKWKLKREGRWLGRDRVICCEHVIDDLSAEVYMEEAEEGKRFNEVQAMGENMVKAYDDKMKGKDGNPAEWKSVRWNKKERSKFPGRGCGSPASFYLDFLATDANGVEIEIHEWMFIKSDRFYRFVVKGAKGEYQKKIRELAMIMDSLKISNPKKRK